MRLLAFVAALALAAVTPAPGRGYFNSSQTGIIAIGPPGFGGNAAVESEATKLSFALLHDSDVAVFERLIVSKRVLPTASLVSERDGLRFDLTRVRVLGKVRNAGYPAYFVTIAFARSHVTCGPPTCLKSPR